VEVGEKAEAEARGGDEVDGVVAKGLPRAWRDCWVAVKVGFCVRL
jgi:hypothetical protein